MSKARGRPEIPEDDQRRIKRMAAVASLRKTAKEVGRSLNTVHKYAKANGDSKVKAAEQRLAEQKAREAKNGGR